MLPAPSAEQRWTRPDLERWMDLIFDVPERGLVVLDEPLDGQVRLAVEHRLHEPAVLLQGVAVAFGGGHGDEAVSLRLIHQIFADPDQDGGSAGADESKMECPMPLLPGRVGARILLGELPWRAREV